MRKDIQLPRRDFLKTSAAAAAAFTILPSGSYGRTRRISANDRVNIATIGCGGMGRANLQALSSQNLVAMCDVDWSYVDNRFAEQSGNDGRVCVRAKTSWAIIDKTSGRPIRVPAEVVAPFLAAE